jgi:hypothetical protein
LVRVGLGEGERRCVVDADMHIFPTNPTAVRLAGAIAGDTVACALEPARRRTRLTVADDTPVFCAICAPVRRWRRNSMMRSQIWFGVGLCNLTRRALRSVKRSGPSVWKWCQHIATVFGKHPPTCAARENEEPPAITCTRRARPKGVSLALL